jgi:hypothetical protein
MKRFSTRVSSAPSPGPPKARTLDLSTTDARAWALAPQLEVTLIGRDFTVWTNPGTGSTCRLELTGDYEVSRIMGHIPKPVVLGQVSAGDALAMISAPHDEVTLRAIAHAIVAVDAVS